MAVRDVLERATSSEAKYFVFLILIIAVHLYDGLIMRFSRSRGDLIFISAWYTLVALIAAFIIFGPEAGFMTKEWLKNLLACLAVSAVAVYIPLIIFNLAAQFFPIVAESIIKITAVLFFSPAWLWFLYMHQGVQQSKVVGTLLAIYFALWLLVVILSFFNYSSIGGSANSYKAPVWQAAKTVIDWIIALVLSFWNALINLPLLIVGAGEDVVAAATGDYYTGQVEEGKDDKDLGVFFEDVIASDPKYHEGDPVSVWATLSAKTVEEPIVITLSCYASNGSDETDLKIQGTIYPGTVNVDSFEEASVSCDFPAGALPIGEYNIILAATFNFKTMAYLKTYFMNKETIRALRRESKDIFKEYPVIEQKPIAIYTQGPIGIGIESNEPPIGISATENIEPLLGVTIDNKWTGKIESFDEVTILVPSSFSVDTSSSSCNFGEGGSENDYRSYTLNDPGSIVDIDLYKSFKCRMVVDASDLDNTPVTIRYVKTTARYRYTIEDSTGIAIEPIENV
ncbi:MAG: hypothetical protein V1859_04885 [archaeon]